MRKLFQFLKPYAPRVLLILCVLVVQAYCDLSLPTYTSNIVNVGIQQSGIDEEIPENISEEEMNRLLLFVSENDRQDIQAAYEKSSESFDYDGEVLTLKDSVKSDNEKLDALTEEMKLPMMLTAGFENGSDTTKQMEGQLKEQLSQVPGIEKMSVFDIFGMMDDTQRAAIVDKITEQMDKMPDSILDQAATINMALSRNGCVMERELARLISKYWLFPNPFAAKDAEGKPIDMFYEQKVRDFKEAGIEYTIKQIDAYRALGVNGIHLYALNKWKDVSEIIDRSGLRTLV